MGTAIKHPMPDRVKQSSVIFDIQALWRSGLSVSARMSKNTNDCLTRSGTGCLIAAAIRQQWVSKGSVTVFLVNQVKVELFSWRQPQCASKSQLAAQPSASILSHFYDDIDTYIRVGDRCGCRMSHRSADVVMWCWWGERIGSVHICKINTAWLCISYTAVDCAACTFVAKYNFLCRYCQGN